jgi:hypothetical protein
MMYSCLRKLRVDEEQSRNAMQRHNTYLPHWPCLLRPLSLPRDLLKGGGQADALGAAVAGLLLHIHATTASDYSLSSAHSDVYYCALTAPLV